MCPRPCGAGDTRLLSSVEQAGQTQRSGSSFTFNQRAKHSTASAVRHNNQRPSQAAAPLSAAPYPADALMRASGRTGLGLDRSAAGRRPDWPSSRPLLGPVPDTLSRKPKQTHRTDWESGRWSRNRPYIPVSRPAPMHGRSRPHSALHRPSTSPVNRGRSRRVLGLAMPPRVGGEPRLRVILWSRSCAGRASSPPESPPDECARSCRSPEQPG